jgi:ribosomal-protein-alanine N-acetyltransferase
MISSRAEALEFRQLSPEWEIPLAQFFEELKNNGDEEFFHPHPLTAAEAMERCAHIGLDLYFVAVFGRKVIGYAMLRGWEDGYEVPSLGIAIHPQNRGMKLGRAMMEFLHCVARVRGVQRIRLKVYKKNSIAQKLYENLGYEFKEETNSELVGYYEVT